MMIAAFNEGPRESRVAITPAIVRHYIQSGFDVICEKNAGLSSGFPNEAYQQAGASIANERKEILRNANILLCVGELSVSDIDGLSPEALLIGHIDSNPETDLIRWCLQHRVSVFSMNNIPRISRAQSMDSLSSQASLSGYRAVIEAIAHFKRVIPMMMTAAGMIHPANILVLGAGVAGLQAIATARRLGAVVYAFDVRAAAKEQVQSLGAEFIEVPHEQDAESAGGYAEETSEEYKAMQAQLIDERAKQADMIICTALIPNKKAPILLKKQTIESMKSGSIIVDLATSRGGNCELSKRDQIIKHGEVTIIGYSNIARGVPTTASELYANNLMHLLHLFTSSTMQITFNEQDEIIQQAMLCHNGKYKPFSSNKE